MPDVATVAGVAGRRVVEDGGGSEGPPLRGGVLDYLEAQLRRFLVLPEESLTLLPPWIVHTYVYTAYPWTPYLLVQSPTQECGKSTLVDFLAVYCANPFVCCNGTAAAVARRVADDHPTMIVDEWDTLSAEVREQYFSILNSGAKETGTYLRCEKVGEKIVAVPFSTYSPKAIVGVVGTKLPNTTLSRCLPFYMQPLPKGMEPVRLRRLHDEPIRKLLASWAKEQQPVLYNTIPPAPKALRGRDRDIWEPLLGVCDALAEGEWPDRIRDLSLRLDKAVVRCESAGVKLLAALKTAFETQKGGEGAVSSLLSEEILALPGVHSIVSNPMALSALLRPFNVRPKNVRRGEKVKKGYLMADLTPAFDAYHQSISLILEGQEDAPPPVLLDLAATSLQPLPWHQRVQME